MIVIIEGQVRGGLYEKSPKLSMTEDSHFGLDQLNGSFINRAPGPSRYSLRVFPRLTHGLCRKALSCDGFHHAAKAIKFTQCCVDVRRYTNSLEFVVNDRRREDVMVCE